jgi:transcriptional regulator with XRE-family HTH domain
LITALAALRYDSIPALAEGRTPFLMPQKRMRLQRRRKSAGLSQEELAYRLGVDPSTVWRWEAGETEPSAWHRPRLGKVLGISRAELEILFEDAETVQTETPTDAPGRDRDTESCIEDEVNRRNLLKALGLARSRGVHSAARVSWYLTPRTPQHLWRPAWRLTA